MGKIELDLNSHEFYWLCHAMLYCKNSQDMTKKGREVTVKIAKQLWKINGVVL